LDAYTLNLNELAKDGKIDNIIGREYELERMMQTLCRRKKNNPILVGESGVGKTAITEGLALKIVNDDVPNKIKGSTIYSLDVGSLLAGTKFRGDLEDRLKQIVAELQKKDKAILLIDELHTVMGSGNGPESSVDAASLLKPALANGTIKCIASTTYDEFRKKILNNKAFARRFQKIDVKEPNSHDTFTILNGLKEKYEQFHNVEFSDKALKRSIDLTQKYISDRYLPDKAIDILDEIGAKNSLSNGKKKTISDADIEDIISEILQIPVKQISKKDTKQVLKLEQKLKKVIFGQETPISQVVKAIKLSKAGLSAENKPIGSFLFCGMTGTGKTELAKQIAKHLNIDFIRFDMSEYSEQHSVAKLIGAPPGYVGFDQSGMLTEEIIKKPHSLLLLDEIEKAHSSVYNTLLQIFDYGILTDNTGRKADFKNIIIIMTSNIGAREMSANSIGFVDNDTINNDTKNAVEKFFSPEFRNRLSGITYFNPLNIEIMKLIVKKEVAILQSSLDKKGATIKFSPSAIKWFAENGYDKKLGARPLQRLISKEIQEKIVDMILMEDISENSKIKVGCKSNKITIDISS
jgi:ATP-dependent Clp protease ATP-binding subunit ClpA